MYALDSFAHIDCSPAHGPGERDIDCGICLEAKGTYASTIVHTVCLNSFHRSCFEEWSKSCRNQNLDVSCPSCRAVLVNTRDADEDSDTEMSDVDDNQDERAEYFIPDLMPDEDSDTEMSDVNDNPDQQAEYSRPNLIPNETAVNEPLDAYYWRVYSTMRDEILQHATRDVQWNLGPVYSFVADDAALQAHTHYEQVHSRSLADAVTYRYFMDRRSRQTLWHLATHYGVDSFRCYRAPAGTAVDYILAPNYLDRYTQGVRSVRPYQPIPAPVLDMQRQIAEFARPELEMTALI